MSVADEVSELVRGLEADLVRVRRELAASDSRVIDLEAEVAEYLDEERDQQFSLAITLESIHHELARGSVHAPVTAADLLERVWRENPGYRPR